MRNYKVKQVNKGLLLQCPSCNKKYKTEIKRQQHVEKDHYYETRNSNRFKFTSEEKARIYKSAGSYIVELYEIRKDEDYGESLAKNLLPQLYKEDLSPNDLKRIMSAQRSFATNLLDQNLLSCDWIAVMDDFEKFFNMGLPHYDTNFCPTLAIDFLWHALMQLPELYIEICEKSCIEIMPHCNIDRTPEEDSQRHEYFLKVFQHKFCKMPTSFPSQLEAFSIEDIREVFGNLYKKELEKVEERRIVDEERKRLDHERYRLITEQYALKREQEDAIIKIISEHFGLSTQELSWGYERDYYLKGYKMGLRDKDLKEYVEDQVEREISKPSTC